MVRVPAFLAGITALFVALKSKPAQAANNAGVNYGVQYGPVYVPPGGLIDLATMRAIIAERNSASAFPNDMLLAVAKVESGHISDATAKFNSKAYRYEPHLGEASYGVFQILASTAKQMGLKGKPEQMYDPRLSCDLAIRYFTWIQNYITPKLGRPGTIRELLYCYNGGVGNFLRNKNGTPQTRQYVERYNTALETIQTA